MFISQIIEVFLFPAVFFPLIMVIVPSAWFQRLHPFFKLGIACSWGAFMGVGISTTRYCNSLTTLQLPIWAQVALTALIVIATGYHIYKLQKNYKNSIGNK